MRDVDRTVIEHVHYYNGYETCVFDPEHDKSQALDLVAHYMISLEIERDYVEAKHGEYCNKQHCHAESRSAALCDAIIGLALKLSENYVHEYFEDTQSSQA